MFMAVRAYNPSPSSYVTSDNSASARMSYGALQGMAANALYPAVDTSALRVPHFGTNLARNLTQEQIDQYGRVTGVKEVKDGKGVTRQILPEMTHYAAEESRDQLTKIGLRIFLGQSGGALEARRDHIDNDSDAIGEVAKKSKEPVVGLQVIKYASSSNARAEVLPLNRKTIYETSREQPENHVYSVGFVPKSSLLGFPKTPTACFYFTNDPDIADQLLEKAYYCNRYFLSAK